MADGAGGGSRRAMPLPVLTLRLAPAATAPAVARHRAAPWLHESDVPEDAASNALLVITELVTNGVLHGGGTIEVRAEVEGEALFIQVTTPLRLAEDRGTVLRPEPAESGRGLAIVGACCDVVDVRDDVSGLRHVVCTIALR